MMIGSTVPAYAATIVAGSGKAQTTQEEESTAQESSEGKSYKADVNPDINWILNPDTYNDAEHDGHSWWRLFVSHSSDVHGEKGFTTDVQFLNKLLAKVISDGRTTANNTQAF